MIGGYFVGSNLIFPRVYEQISGTGSMYPTFPKGTGQTDKENADQTVARVIFLQYPGGIEIFGKKYFAHSLQRGDIVAFQNETTEQTTREQYGIATGYIKRVIGLPGDTVELRDGLVFLNNQPLREPYTASPHSTFAESFLAECTKVVVPDKAVFVMGDNRKGSGDSREF